MTSQLAASPGTRQPDSSTSAHAAVTRHSATGAAVALGAAAGVACAVLTPRGPLDFMDAVASAAICAGSGFLAGRIGRSRLTVLLVPAAFVAALELGRLHVVGPSVDAPHTTTYGIIALLFGRGVQSLYTLLPLMAGVASGRWSATRGTPRVLGRVGAVVLTLATVGALALAAIPGRTHPIIGTDGRPVPGSIAEITRVDAGGHSLGLLLRGRDTTNPVLLFLPGGPGGSEFGAMRIDTGLESHFVVATLDPRGAGSSYDQLDPASTLTFDGAISDAVAVTEYLRERFDQERVYVVGQSYGSLVAVLAAVRRPDLYHAVVGSGQMVSVRETDQRMYRDRLAWAERNGLDGMVTTLRGIGEPPYSDVLNYEVAVAGEQVLYPYDHSPNAEGAGGFSEHIFAGEYSMLQRLHMLPAFLDSFAVLYPQIQELDLRVDAPRLEVPVMLVEGHHEIPPRRLPAQEWFDLLEAPDKSWIELDTSGHRANFEQPAAFTEAVVALHNRVG